MIGTLEIRSEPSDCWGTLHTQRDTYEDAIIVFNDDKDWVWSLGEVVSMSQIWGVPILLDPEEWEE